MSDSPTFASFAELGLSRALLKAVQTVGYETPSPIQAQAIPPLMEGHDLLGHAPTGTGKTAAFALPLLDRLDLKAQPVQVLVLTPTRELTIQVAEAFQRYATHLKGFHVLPVYGGQDYSGQIRALRRGVHVVVGTPGRIMDHMRRGTLKLDGLTALVLDEADEMLRMGFIDDVQWILERAPEQRQMALFSATMPAEIRTIANRYLVEPRSIAVKSRTATAESIEQRYWQVGHLHKLDALTRILETEPFDGVLIFVRTKIATNELAEKLTARGYAAEALNGDMAQKSREQMVQRLKRGSIDILVATDVAARGLDVDRISHVINYDIPYDTEAYIHRIGRTGRAGRTGQAILFVAPRERRMLATIERATRSPIEPLVLPTTEMVNNQRIAKFKQRISDVLAEGELEFLRGIVESYQQEHDVAPFDVAAALAKMAIGKRALLLPADDAERANAKPARARKGDAKAPKAGRSEAGRNAKQRQGDGRRAPAAAPPAPEGMERFRIEVGHDHEVKPGNIVGAIANEAGLDSAYIGAVSIYDSFSLIDLPVGMPRDVFRHLKKTWVCGQRLQISRFSEGDSEASEVGPSDRKPAEAGSDSRRKHRKQSDRPQGDKAPKPPRRKSARKKAARGKKKAARRSKRDT